MKLTQKDQDLFKALSNSEIGKDIIDYLERLISHTCDVRHMGNDDTPQSAKKAAEVIQTHLIDKIRLRTKPKHVKTGQFE